MPMLQKWHAFEETNCFLIGSEVCSMGENAWLTLHVELIKSLWLERSHALGGDPLLMWGNLLLLFYQMDT